MCDCLVALAGATEEGVTLFAKNSDRPPGEVQVMEWIPPRRDAGTLECTHVSVAPHPTATLGCVLSRPTWGWGAEHGVNEAGVAVGNTSVFTTLDPRTWPPALTGMDLVRLALERATSASAAVEVITGLIDTVGQGGSGHDPVLVPGGKPYWNAFLVADPSCAFVIDTSGPRWAVEEVGAQGTRAISNRTSILTFDAEHRHPRQPVERLVDPRWHASQHALSARPVTVAGLAAHLRSHDSCGDTGWSVCMHVDGVEATTASMIAALRPDGGSEVWWLVGNPCEHEYRPLRFADAPGLLPAG